VFRFHVGGRQILATQQISDKIECSTNGKKHLQTNDVTPPSGGKIGLRTKADTQTIRCDLQVTNLAK
jgi:hypothetical protein